MSRLALFALIAGGVCLVAMGARRWSDQRAATATVDRFFNAVASARRSDALDCLTIDQRRQFEADPQPIPWIARPHFHVDVQRLTIDGATAAATVEISYRDDRLDTELTLLRGDDGEWRIDSVFMPSEISPPDVLNQPGIASDLARRLRDRPDIVVERLPATIVH